jgi:hypothetical protein
LAGWTDAAVSRAIPRSTTRRKTNRRKGRRFAGLPRPGSEMATIVIMVVAARPHAPAGRPPVDDPFAAVVALPVP